MNSIASKSSRIGFVGLGDIGLPMARQLLKAGFAVTVFDLRQEPVARIVSEGASEAGSLASLASSCDYICVAVIDETQMQRITSGPGGLFENAKPGTVILSHSTMPPEVAVHFDAAAKAKGLEWLDTPMSGASIAAAEGTLTFIVGGEAVVLERCRPLLNAMGSHVFHLGPVGTGQVGKLVNGLMLHVGYIVALEALGLAAAAGVPEETIIALAKVSTGNSWVVQHWGHMDHLVESHVIGRDEFINTHARKDIRDALIAATHLRQAMPVTALAMQLYPGLLYERQRQLGKD
jgi:3-hydroxyisobutyrate dehydrogenase-like beta-hydroxyacid dehydrogenase